LQAEDARYKAQIGNDFEALDRLFAKDLVYIHSSTVQDTKASFTESLRSGKVSYHTMERSDTKVRVFGNVAIITGKAVFEVTSRGRDMTLNLLFHAVWVRRDSGLQFVSWQATRLPGGNDLRICQHRSKHCRA
jgi:ketosteroid isomerase-like protein